MSADYFDRLEAELRAAVPRVAVWPEVDLGAADASANGAAGRTRRLLPRLPLAPIGLAAAVAVAVVVVVGAVALLGHRPSATTGPTRPSGPPPSATAGEYPTLQQLRRHFAVLRRPQAAADRSLPVRSKLQPVGTLTGMTRLALRLALGDLVFVTVVHEPAGGYTPEIWLVEGHHDTTGETAGGPGAQQPSPFQSAVPDRPTTWIGLMPDGIRRADWTFECDQPRVSCGSHLLTVPVEDNIAIADQPTAWCTRGGACPDVVATVSYGSGGQIVARWPGTHQHGSSRVLSADRIDGIRLGRPLSALVRGLRPMLGAPKISHGTPMCGVDGTAVWPASRAGEQLQVTTRRSRIVGYQYTARDGASKPHRRSLETTRGLGIGDTLARGRALYGRRFRISNAQGGTWSVGAGYYGLRGYAWTNRADSVAGGPHRAVSSIAAGDVGCPALSP